MSFALLNFYRGGDVASRKTCVCPLALAGRAGGHMLRATLLLETEGLGDVCFWEPNLFLRIRALSGKFVYSCGNLGS